MVKFGLCCAGGRWRGAAAADDAAEEDAEEDADEDASGRFQLAQLQQYLLSSVGRHSRIGGSAPPRDPSRDPRAFPPRHAPYSMHTVSLQVAVYSLVVSIL